MKYLFITLFSLFTIHSVNADCESYTEQELLMENQGDDRLVRTSSSPDWLQAVGKFVFVKTPQWQLEQGKPETYQQCSVSLISDTIGGDGQIIVGAGHCISQWVSGESKPSPYIDELRQTKSGQHREHNTVHDWDFEQENTVITFTSNTGLVVKRRLAEIFYAETHQGDYFIGRLDSPIPYSQIQPLLNAPADYSDLLSQEDFPSAFATMAGFSHDSGKGQNGQVMTYDNCELMGGANGRKMGHCYTYSGASGGATTVTVDLSKSSDDNAEFWLEYFSETLNGQFERKAYTFWVGNLFGARCTQAKVNRTFFTESTYYTSLLDAILSDYR